MSLIRTALRFQAIEVLNADPVIDGLVRGRVYDSRIGVFDHREPVPVIVVTTEETKGEAWDRQNGGMPFRTSCDLVVEIAMNVVAGPEDQQVLGYVATDSELEAFLDLIEERTIQALAAGDTSQAVLLREHVVRRFGKIASQRFATDQTGEKLAIHLLTLTVDLCDPPADDIFDPPTGEFAALPEPLRTLAPHFLPGLGPRETCTLLAGKLPAPTPPPGVPPFAGVDLVLVPQPLDPATTPDRAADLAAGRFVGLAANP